MEPKDYLRASNGSGEAVMAVVTTERTIGSATLITDSVLNWPSRGIATSGTLDPDTGLIDPDTATVFKYHLDGSIITIDEFAPGYPDEGNEEDQVVVIKPNTYWADILAESIGEGGASVHIGDTPPPNPEEGDLWGDTSESGLNDLVVAVGSMLMPIGFIVTLGVSEDPNVLYGFGTWERIEGKFIVGVDDSDSDFDLNDTGGEKEHTLTIGEMPEHTHIQNQHRHALAVTSTNNGNTTRGASPMANNSGNDSTHSTVAQGAFVTATNQNTGGDQPHNNLPPFIAKYIWQRTA